MNKTRVMGIVWGLLSAAAYGLIPLFTLPILKNGISVETTLVYRFAIACIAMFPLMLWTRTSLAVSLADLGKLALISAFYLGAVIAFFHSFRFLPSSIAATIQFLYPVMVMLIMIIFFGEKFNWLVTLSVVLGFSGVVFLSAASSPAAINGTGENIALGVGLSLLAGLGNSLYMVSLQVARLPRLNGLAITFYVMVFGTIYAFANALANFSLEWIPISCIFWLAVLLALVTAVFSNLALVWSIKLTGSTLAAILGVMEPLTAVAVGITVFHEMFTAALGLGVILISSSVFIAIFATRNKKD